MQKSKIIIKMQLSFTKHAVKRIEERGIHFEEIMECLDLPDQIRQKEELTIFIKKDNISEKLLILICIIKNKECKIITVFKTSQVNRYLNNN